MKTLTAKAFTLVELLIVIGIIGLLAVTVLLALNPAEAQRKSRDTKRIRDAGTIQAALEQIVNEGIPVPTASGELGHTAGAVSSVSGTPNTNVNVASQNCTYSGSGAAVHWLGSIDLCPYIKTVPLDPQNGTMRNFLSCTGSGCTPAPTSLLANYRARVSGSDYEINVRQESASNASKVTGDGGNSSSWFEVFGGNNALFSE